MSFIKSLLLGLEGNYKFNNFGIEVEFASKNDEPSTVTSSDLDIDPITGELIKVNSEETTVEESPTYKLTGAGILTRVAATCTNSSLFRLISQGYTHVLVHEMGHTLASKLFSDTHIAIRINPADCTGDTTGIPNSLKDWQRNIVHIAGPMANVAFSSCKLAAAVALKRYISWPVSCVLGGSSLLWMSGELLYAAVSGIKQDEGDFGCIARTSKTQLMIAGTLLVSACALGVILPFNDAI